MNFKAKHILYVPRVWHLFITSRILLSINVCEVTKERDTVNYSIPKNIKFNVGKIIEEFILYNREGKLNLVKVFKDQNKVCSGRFWSSKF